MCKNICRDWSRRHHERDWHAICHSMTLACSNFVISRSYDFPSLPPCHPYIPHTYNYFHPSPLPIHRAICPKSSYRFILISSHHSINNLFIILYIILALVLSSKPWRKGQKYLENIFFPIDPSPPIIRSKFHSKSSFELNEVNWIQIHWTISSLFWNLNPCLGF
jgi:hypothetical protein